jgi:AMP phosphorylase
MITIPIKIIDIRSKDPFVMLAKETASKLFLKHTDVVIIKSSSAELSAYPVVVTEFIEKDTIGISPKNADHLGVKDGNEVTLSARKKPLSYKYITDKIDGKIWNQNEINTIVTDISNRRLTSLEISTFALVSQFKGYNNDELVGITKSMADAGTQFDFEEPTYDKHSIGGIPGNKITPVIVSIAAAAGLLIPKTSSRAITSPSGTADTMEVLANVEFSAEELSELAPKVRGMIAWNGGLNLAPLDSIVIEVKKELGIDPRDQMLASIVSTKLAMGVDKLVFDIPTGPQTKMKDNVEALEFAHSMINLCRQLDIRVEAALTLGDQPLGRNIGPALEAVEALQVLEGKGPASVIEKSVELAGMLLEMGGLANLGQGSTVAHEYIKSGKALAKFQEIVEVQGGEKGVTSNSVETAEYTVEVKALMDGYIQDIDSKRISSVANAAGTPKFKKAGIRLNFRKGDFVHEGDSLFTIYSPSESKLASAVQTATTSPPFIIEGMIIRRVGSISQDKSVRLT